MNIAYVYYVLLSNGVGEMIYEKKTTNQLKNCGTDKVTKLYITEKETKLYCNNNC